MVRVTFPQRETEVYIADVSLIAAIIAATEGDIRELPDLQVVPELLHLVDSVSGTQDASSTSHAQRVLPSGLGRHQRTLARLHLSPERARSLLARLNATQGSDSEATALGLYEPESTLSPESPETAVDRIREATVDAAKRRGLPVLAIGGSFKRSLHDIPTLVYEQAVSGVESLRQRVRGNTGDDTRCIWVTFFVWMAGQLAGIEGMPERSEIAVLIDP